MPQRPGCANVRRGTPDHPARLFTNCLHLAGALVDCHHRGLEHHHAAAAPIHNRVRRTKIDRQLTVRPRPPQSHPTPENHPRRTKER